jgi:LeuA allosteric (dimerisation) domain
VAINGQLDALPTALPDGDGSAWACVAAKLRRYGLDPDAGVLAILSRNVALLQRQGWQLADADASFVLLALRQMTAYRPWFKLDRYSVLTRSAPDGDATVEASIKLHVDGAVRHVVREGRSAIDALCLALLEALRSAHPGCADMVLRDYSAHALKGPTDSAGCVHVRLGIWDRAHGRGWASVAVAGDMVHATLLALVDAFEFKRWLDGCHVASGDAHASGRIRLGDPR